MISLVSRYPDAFLLANLGISFIIKIKLSGVEMGGELVKAVIEKIPSWVFSVIGIGIVGLFLCFIFIVQGGS